MQTQDSNNSTAEQSKLVHIFIDMDGVLAHFSGSKLFRNYEKTMRKPPRMYEEGFFENLPVLAGARWAIRVLLKNPNLKLHILTKPVTNSYSCYSEKVAWIAKNFPELLGSIIIAHDKQFIAGPDRVLVDDFAEEWKQSWEAAGGVFEHFITDKSKENWKQLAIKYNPDYFHMERL